MPRLRFGAKEFLFLARAMRWALGRNASALGRSAAGCALGKVLVGYFRQVRRTQKYSGRFSLQRVAKCTKCTKCT